VDCAAIDAGKPSRLAPVGQDRPLADITPDPRLGKANNLPQGEWEDTMHLQAVAASGKHDGIMSHEWCS
jgi:hypothetical protein